MIGERFAGEEPALLAGPVALLFATLGIGGAIALAPWFAFSEHALSDLGVAGRPSAPVFNGGLVLAGVTALGFAAELWDLSADPLHRAGALACALAVGSMALVGVFPAPHPLHFPVAVGTYLGFTATFLLRGAGDRRAGATRWGTASVALAVVHVLGWSLWIRFGAGPLAGLAVPEVFGALLFGGWTLATVARHR